MTTEPTTQPSITFLNSTGDITISWEKDKEEAMLALIEKKMKENYSFFILKPRLGGLFGTKKVPVENIDQVRKAGSVTVPDALAKQVVMNLGDDDVSGVVASGSAKVVPISRQTSVDTVRRASSAAEVLQHQTVAVRPLVGG